MGAAELTRFLTALAVDRKVAASTQNQALSALLFLYREVLGLEVPWLDGLVRAKRPQRLRYGPEADSIHQSRALASRMPVQVRGQEDACPRPPAPRGPTPSLSDARRTRSRVPVEVSTRNTTHQSEQPMERPVRNAAGTGDAQRTSKAKAPAYAARCLGAYGVCDPDSS